MKVTVISVGIGALGTVTKGLIQGLGKKMTCRDHPNYCIIEISQNTDYNPEDSRRLAVSQTPV